MVATFGNVHPKMTSVIGVSTRNDSPIRVTTAIVFAISRALAWGLAPTVRADVLAEVHADWEAMAADRGPIEMLWRAIRGIPGAILARLDAQEITALPAGFALAILGLGGVIAGGVETAYPSTLRLFIALAGLGALLLGMTLIAEPRRLITRRHAIPSGVVSVGFIGMALSIPTDQGWAGVQLPQESHLFDAALAASFTVVGAAFAFAAVIMMLNKVARFAGVAAIAVAAALAAFAIAELAWALFIAPYDLAITAPTIGASLAAASAAHVIPRLRHMEML